MRIPREEMYILHSASELKDIADTAEVDAQKSSIAFSLNNAANTGETSVIWLGDMLDEVKEALESDSYTVEAYKTQDGEPSKFKYVISFKDAGSGNDGE